jgi:hypothetical protein
MISSVDLKSAKQEINKVGQVLVFFIAEGVGHKEVYTKEFMEEISIENPTWKVLKVNIMHTMNRRVSNKEAPLYFETDTYPELYIFKNQSRKVVVKRVLSKDEINSLLAEADNDTLTIF